jgi:Tfp pilus assembly protein PilX
MNKLNQQTPISHQNGVAVLLVSIVLLIGVTLITIFAAQVGVMDQRIAGNEYRHKEAKAAASAALEQASAFIEQNPDIYNGSSSNWSDCTPIQSSFPCRVDGVDYEMVYSSISGSVVSPLSYVTPLDSGIESNSYIVFTTSTAGGDARNILTAIGTGSSLDGTADAYQEVSYMQATLLNPGQIPPVMASTIDINGSFTIVADPHTAASDDDGDNPLSAWVKTLDGSSTGSWQTCNLSEYKNGTQVCALPTSQGGYDETQTNNSGWGGCSCETNLSDDDNLSPKDDILVDPNFPDDVFGYVFSGDSKSQVELRAKGINHHFSDCSDLDNVDLSEGSLVWIEGDCTIPDDIGSREYPILLVVEDLLKINSNHNVWGILLSITDIQLSGGPIIHGSIITDSNSKLSAGGYTQVYDDEVISRLQDPDVNVELAKVKYSHIDY